MPFLARLATQAAQAWGMLSGGRVKLAFVISANANDTVINVSTLTGYAPGNTDLTVTVNPNVILTSTVIGGNALSIIGSVSGDTITINNSGYIVGLGGKGADYLALGASGSGALRLTGATGTPLNIKNNGVIGGGGGGGGNGGAGQSLGLFTGYYFFNEYAGGGTGGGGIVGGAPGGYSGYYQFFFQFGTNAGGTAPDYIPGEGGFGASYANTRGGVGGNGGTIGTAGGAGAAGGGRSGVESNPTLGGVAGNAITLNSAVYTQLPSSTVLSSVVIGTSGSFTCAATTLRLGQTVVVTGTNTGTGSITGYASGTTYFIISTNGTTQFTLAAAYGGSSIMAHVSGYFNGSSTRLGIATAKTPIGTAAGTPIGLTFTLDGTIKGVVG